MSVSQEIDMVLLGHLIGVYLQAKNEEAGAKQARLAAESAVAAIIPGPDNGQCTVALGDGRKVVVKRKLNYKADCDELLRQLNQIGEAMDKSLPKPIKHSSTLRLDVSGYEWYRENMPEVYKQICDLVVVTPAKTSVEIK